LVFNYVIKHPAPALHVHMDTMHPPLRVLVTPTAARLMAITIGLRHSTLRIARTRCGAPPHDPCSCLTASHAALSAPAARDWPCCVLPSATTSPARPRSVTIFYLYSKTPLSYNILSLWIIIAAV
jgi:hypothetical protein